MQVKLVGMIEGVVDGIGIVQRDVPITVSDELGKSLLAQTGMWELVEDKKIKKGDS